MVPSSARAADPPPPCSLQPNPIYGTGGSATKPILSKVAAALVQQATPRTIVYQSPGACTGYAALAGNTLLTGTATYWDKDANEKQCTVDGDGSGKLADFANMGNQATSCEGVASLPADIGDFEGPVNAYTLIVPKGGSSQTVISREAAHFVFGFGQNSQVAPWTDETQLFVRDKNSAAQIFIALAADVPASKFKGNDTKNNQKTITDVSQASKPQNAIGLVSGEVADANRNLVSVLAYQHAGQTCGFWPDSSATAFDKRSVRNGQYWLWAPLHFFSKIDATTKKPVKPEVAEFFGLFSGDTTLPNVDMLAIETKSGNVPRCAMNVWRNGDNGAIYKKEPTAPCGCAFEKLATGTAPSTCTACDSDAKCGGSTPTCRSGFCEAK